MYTLVQFLIKGKHYKVLVNLWNFSQLLTFKDYQRKCLDILKDKSTEEKLYTWKNPNDNESVSVCVATHSHVCKKGAEENIKSIAAFLARQYNYEHFFHYTCFVYYTLPMMIIRYLQKKKNVFKATLKGKATPGEEERI